jgi:hypothetical protein
VLVSAQAAQHVCCRISDSGNDHKHCQRRHDLIGPMVEATDGRRPRQGLTLPATDPQAMVAMGRYHQRRGCGMGCQDGLPRGCGVAGRFGTAPRSAAGQRLMLRQRPQVSICVLTYRAATYQVLRTPLFFWIFGRLIPKFRGNWLGIHCMTGIGVLGSNTSEKSFQTLTIW